MINKLIFFFILIILLLYLFSLNPEHFQTNTNTNIIMHVINWNPTDNQTNITTYIDLLFCDDVIIRSLNDIYTDHTFILNKFIKEDYKNNLRNHYHNYPNHDKFDTKEILTSNNINSRIYDKGNGNTTLEDFINNDISILESLLKSKDNPPKLLKTLILKMISNDIINDIQNIHIIFVPYLYHKIIKLDKHIILIGLYHNEIRTITNLPNNLENNWITNYYNKKKAIKKINCEIDGQQSLDNTTNKKLDSEVKQLKENILKIKTHFSRDISEKKSIYNSNNYKLQNLYSINFNTLPEVRKYKNDKKKKNAIITEMMKKIELEQINPLLKQNKELLLEIKKYKNSKHNLLNNKTLEEAEKEYNTKFTKLVNIYDMVDKGALDSCKLTQKYKQTILNNSNYISKHQKYIENLQLIFKLGYAITNIPLPIKCVIVPNETEPCDVKCDTIGYNIKNINKNDIDKCEIQLENPELCIKSKKYERKLYDIHKIEEPKITTSSMSEENKLMYDLKNRKWINYHNHSNSFM